MTEAERIEKAGEEYIRSIGEDPSIMYSGDVHLAGEAFIAGQKAEHERLQQQIKEKDEHIEKCMNTIRELEKMYANTHGKLRDLQVEYSDLQKEHSDNKANLHRAYNGLENHKKLKAELKSAQELNRELVEGMEIIFNMFYDDDDKKQHLRSIINQARNTAKPFLQKGPQMKITPEYIDKIQNIVNQSRESIQIIVIHDDQFEQFKQDVKEAIPNTVPLLSHTLNTMFGVRVVSESEYIKHLIDTGKIQF